MAVALRLAGRVRTQVAVFGIAAGLAARQIDAALAAAYGVLIDPRRAPFFTSRHPVIAARPPLVEPHCGSDQYDDENLTKADGQGYALSLAG